MKTKIILLIIALFIVAMPRLHAQSIDSLVAAQTKTIKQANAELQMDMKIKSIQDRFPRQWKHIITYKKKCNSNLKAAAEASETHKKLHYIDGAFRYYNKARKLYNKVTNKKNH